MQFQRPVHFGQIRIGPEIIKESPLTFGIIIGIFAAAGIFSIVIRNLYGIWKMLLEEKNRNMDRLQSQLDTRVKETSELRTQLDQSRQKIVTLEAELQHLKKNKPK